MMKCALLVLALFAVMLPVTFAAPVMAADAAKDPAFNFVKQTTDKGLSFLANPKITDTQKTAEFKTLLNASFDLETIGRFALGKYWNTATPAERNEYQALFRKMVVDVYSNRFGDYKGQKLEILSSRAVGTDFMVASVMKNPTGASADVKIDWRVRNKGAGFKIVDVIVEGVSMSVTQRSDFASVIQGGGGKVAALISGLKKNGVIASQ